MGSRSRRFYVYKLVIKTRGKSRIKLLLIDSQGVRYDSAKPWLSPLHDSGALEPNGDFHEPKRQLLQSIANNLNAQHRACVKDAPPDTNEVLRLLVIEGTTVAQSRTRSEAAADDTPVNADVSIGFSKGVMLVNGIRQIVVRSIERLSSNEMTRYQAIEWADPSTAERRVSCNCPGWANRRYCKHTQELIDQPGIGLLDDETFDLAVGRNATVAGTVTVTKTDDGRQLRGFIFND